MNAAAAVGRRRILLSCSSRMLVPRTSVVTAAPSRIRQQQPQIRTMMDAKLRPSHSGMFPAASSKFLQKNRPDKNSGATGEDPNVYLILAQRAAMAMGLVYGLTEYVADITLCEGPSMSPTIRPYGEIVLIDKYSVRRGVLDGLVGEKRSMEAIKRQQQHDQPEFWHQPVISVTELQTKVPYSWRDCWRHFQSPIAIGDVVVSKHPSRPGTVCKRVTGLPGDQILKPNGGMLTVPDGHVWLEGDNPNNSSDSRSYGALPVALLQGRVVARIWPLRGGAWMRRGARPQQPKQHNSGSTVLPAGYQGEHIVKSLLQDKEQAEPSGRKLAKKRGTSYK